MAFVEIFSLSLVEERRAANVCVEHIFFSTLREFPLKNDIIILVSFCKMPFTVRCRSSIRDCSDRAMRVNHSTYVIERLSYLLFCIVDSVFTMGAEYASYSFERRVAASEYLFVA